MFDRLILAHIPQKCKGKWGKMLDILYTTPLIKRQGGGGIPCFTEFMKR
jgi:hypothetical protein